MNNMNNDRRNKDAKDREDSMRTQDNLDATQQPTGNAEEKEDRDSYSSRDES